MANKITHSELCDKAESWLKKYHNFDGIGHVSSCSVVIKEMVSIAMEEPDCIGFNSSVSILIECKTSRSDFLADKKKPFRHNPEKGMGNYRFYLTPPKLLKPEELPEKWGLLELHGRSIKTIKHPEFFNGEYLIRQEHTLLISALRRAYGK